MLHFGSNAQVYGQQAYEHGSHYGVQAHGTLVDFLTQQGVPKGKQNINN